MNMDLVAALLIVFVSSIHAEVDYQPVDDVIDRANTTEDECRIYANQGCTPPLLELPDYGIKCGQRLHREEAVAIPRVIYSDAVPDYTYLLVMVDPDAPGHTFPHTWRHWLVSNIKGSNLVKGTPSGTILTEYHPPTPPSGVHRYMIFIFQQSSGGQEIHLKSPKKRSQFNIAEFVKENKLCSPDASFMYRSS